MLNKHSIQQARLRRMEKIPVPPPPVPAPPPPVQPPPAEEPTTRRKFLKGAAAFVGSFTGRLIRRINQKSRQRR